MATAQREYGVDTLADPGHAMTLAPARALVWTLSFSGWLVLGSLGRAQLPLWASGLVPLSLWMAAAGGACYVCDVRMPPVRTLRTTTVVLGALVAASLAWSQHGGAAMAVCVAAVAWGGLLACASRLADLMRPASLPDARQVASSVADATWRDPSTWSSQCARWTMLPMMATLITMAQWCGGDMGMSAAQWVGLHLAAMVLPPLLLSVWFSGRPRPGTGPWCTAAMAGGLAWWMVMPDLRGLMAMSLCHSVAWGLATFASMAVRPAAARASRDGAAPALAGSLLSALIVLGIGVAIGDLGPVALETVHVVLGLVAVAGAVMGCFLNAPGRPGQRGDDRPVIPTRWSPAAWTTRRRPRG